MTLQARPSPGYVFDNWSGSIDGIADPSQKIVVFQMGDDRTIAANFSQSDLRYTATTTVEPSGSGSVRLEPAEPAGGYQVNTSVTVRAVDQNGYIFNSWKGDLGGRDNPSSLLLDDNKAIVAIFNPTITAYCSPAVGGEVALDPSQPTVGYFAGTEVTLTATAAKGYRFVGWEGDVSESSRSTTITVDGPKTIVAKFAEKSTSPKWWLWLLLGLIGLLGALVLLRVVYARIHARAWDEQTPDA